MASITKLLVGSTASTLTTDMCQVLKIRWVGPTVAGHTITLTDQNNNIVWSSIAPAANTVEIDTLTTNRESDDHAYRWNGIKISQISSGTVYIYLR